MTVRPVASIVPRSAIYALMLSPAIVSLPSKSASCVRISATGVRKNAARMTWITVNAAPSHVGGVPMLAEQWLADQKPSARKPRGPGLSLKEKRPGVLVVNRIIQDSLKFCWRALWM